MRSPDFDSKRRYGSRTRSRPLYCTLSSLLSRIAWQITSLIVRSSFVAQRVRPLRQRTCVSCIRPVSKQAWQRRNVPPHDDLTVATVVATPNSFSVGRVRRHIPPPGSETGGRQAAVHRAAADHPPEGR